MKCLVRVARIVAVLVSAFWTCSETSSAQTVGIRPQTTAPMPKEVQSPKQSCMRLTVGTHSCSATVIASSGSKYLAISCNHCFARQPFPGAPFPRAPYPLKCQLSTLDGKEVYDAIAIDGDPASDLSLLVFTGFTGPVARISGGARPGDYCEHYGISSGHAEGRIAYYASGGGIRGDASERARISSIPGDSGAGIFVGGRLAAVNWGNYPRTGEQGGTAILYVLLHANTSIPLSRDYHDLWDNLPKASTVPEMPKEVVPPPVVSPPNCPGGVCPVPAPQYRFPRLRLIFGR